MEMDRVRAIREMESPGGNSDAYRSPSSSSSSSSSSSRRFGLPSASSIIQAPLSALLEYSGILRAGAGGGRSNYSETEGLIGGRLSGFRDEPAAASGNDGEVSIRIIGATEQEHDREGTGLVVGQAREASAALSSEVVSAQSMSASAAALAPDAPGDSRADRGVGEGISQSLNGNGDGEGGDGGGGGGGGNGRDSSYQRYDIQQAARWIEQVLPFSLLLLVVFIRQHLQGIPLFKIL